MDTQDKENTQKKDTQKENTHDKGYKRIFSPLHQKVHRA